MFTDLPVTDPLAEIRAELERVKVLGNTLHRPDLKHAPTRFCTACWCRWPCTEAEVAQDAAKLAKALERAVEILQADVSIEGYVRVEWARYTDEERRHAYEDAERHIARLQNERAERLNEIAKQGIDAVRQHMAEGEQARAERAEKALLLASEALDLNHDNHEPRNSPADLHAREVRLKALVAIRSALTPETPEGKE